MGNQCLSAVKVLTAWGCPQAIKYPETVSVHYKCSGVAAQEWDESESYFFHSSIFFFGLIRIILKNTLSKTLSYSGLLSQLLIMSKGRGRNTALKLAYKMPLEKLSTGRI